MPTRTATRKRPHTRTLHESWGRNIKSARTRARLTQSQLAERVGVAQGTLSQWEAGEQVPSDSSKFKLSAALNRSLAELFPWPIFVVPE